VKSGACPQYVRDATTNQGTDSKTNPDAGSCGLLRAGAFEDFPANVIAPARKGACT
jgi:hypothetical protein